MAVKGADFLISANISLIPLMILFILLSAAINMLMGSASAKWAILAPVFIPMVHDHGLLTGTVAGIVPDW